MLYLTRKVGESIIINNDIEVIVIEVNKKNTKLGIKFPSSATILRKEIHNKIVKENIIASDKSSRRLEDLKNMNYKNLLKKNEK